jgi:hypothetical protein
MGGGSMGFRSGQWSTHTPSDRFALQLTLLLAYEDLGMQRFLPDNQLMVRAEVPHDQRQVQAISNPKSAFPLKSCRGTHLLITRICATAADAN